MKINRNDLCPCGSGKKYKKCCEQGLSDPPLKKYVNAAHEWMDRNILKGKYPDLYGYLILVDHRIPSSEIWEQLKFWSEQYLNSGTVRSERFHAIIDEEIELQIENDAHNGYPPCFCSRGCSNCCYQPIACTDEEAQLIYSYCADNGIYIDWKKIERQQICIEYDSEDNFNGITTWNNQSEEDQSCVFLKKETQECRIWDVRPFVCRTHLAEKTNEFCRSHNGVPNPKARGIHYPVCSYILSAVFTIHHTSIGKMMGRLLLNLRNE